MKPFTALLLILVVLLACKKWTSGSDETASASASAQPPPPDPIPGFPGLRLGMSLSELVKAYPAQASLKDCAPRLLGGAHQGPPKVPGAEKKPYSRCADAVDVGGALDDEVRSIVEVSTKIDRKRRDDLASAILYVVAQVRGAVRAGTVSEDEVFKAAGTPGTAFGAVLTTSYGLSDGARAFTRLRSSRRPLCATLSKDCNDFDPESVRDYVFGKYSYGKIDSKARRMCQYGNCRGPFVRNERTLRLRFIQRAGALAGLGLSAAGRKTPLDPDVPKQFAAYSGRSRLDAKMARLGVVLANKMADTEAYWKGSIMVWRGEKDAAAGTGDPWKSAVLWFENEKLKRVLVNIQKAKLLSDLPALLKKHYRTKCKTQAAITTCEIDEGTARLDIGAATALVVSK